MDMLLEMFKLRREYMAALQATRCDGVEPNALDLTKKESQRHLRDVALRGVEEVFEALSELRNTKPHRATEFPEFDREKFLEEFVDAFNFFLTVIILTGFSAEDLFKKYREKDEIIHERIASGY